MYLNGYDLTFLLERMAQHAKSNGSDIEELAEDYAQRIKILIKRGFGDVYSNTGFYHGICKGVFTDTNGHGEFVDNDGDTLLKIKCDAKWFMGNTPKNCHYVIWFPKAEG